MTDHDSERTDPTGDKPKRPRRRRRRSSGARREGGAPDASTDSGTTDEPAAKTDDAPRASDGGGDAPPRKRRRKRGGGDKAKGGDAPARAPKDDTDADDSDGENSKAIPIEDCLFAEYGLQEDLVRGLAAAGYHTPSPIQARSLPFALEGRDVIGQAKTGTGKTAAFLVPSLQTLTDRKGPRVLVVVPTRELAMQVHEEALTLGRFMAVRSLAIYGGDPMKRQLDELEFDPQVIAATPGRLLDHISRRTLRIDDLDVIILDEADRMFDLGFREDIAKIMSHAKGRGRTMLFSATLSDEVLALSKRYMNDPAQVFLAPDKMTVDDVDQQIFPIDGPLKTKLLQQVLKRESPERSIIFTRTKIGADKLAMRLQKVGVDAREIHSGLPQKKRERIMQDFRDGKFRYLIATDVAARGIDIDDVSHVINYDIPENAEDYVHRIGRTGRMGKTGRAVTFVTRDDGMFLTAIEKLINQHIPEHRYDDFDYRVDSDEPKFNREVEKPKVQTPRTLMGFRRPRGR